MRTTSVVAACLLLAGPAFAQSRMQPPAMSQAQDRTQDNVGAAPASGLATQDFVNKVAISDMFEIESSKLARKKADADGKKFAAKMVKDHGKTSSELKSMVKSGKVKAQLPTALDAAHKQKLDQLKSASGAEFDRAYDTMQREAHQEAVALFDRYAQNGDNPQLKSWAAKTLPTLKGHLSMAEDLH